MSLIAHWPLNGNVEDVSGNDHHLTLNAGTYGAGKIGQSYISDASAEYLYISAADNDFQNVFNNNFSISFWYNANIGTEGTNRGILQYGASSGTDLMLHLLLRASGNYFAIGFYADDYNTGYVPTLGEWNHYTVIGDRNNLKQKLYINGVFYGERNTVGWLNTSNSNFYIANYANYYPNGYLNDFRIYDHVLTDMEIQEIARAKILHYTFDDFQEPTTNILPNPNFEDRNYNTPYTASQWGGDTAIITYYSEGGYNNLPYYHLIRTADGSGGTYHDNHSPITLVEGKTYTLSAYIKSNQDSYWANQYVLTFNRISDNLYLMGPGVTLTREWKRYSFTKTISASEAGVYQIRNIVYDGANTEFYWSGIQAEEKPNATEYVAGSRTGRVNDYSGFFNHSDELSEIYTPQWVADSKIGMGAYKFSNNGTPRNFITKAGFYTPDNITMLVWFKANEVGYGTYHIPLSIDTTNFEIAVSSSGVLRTGYNISGTRRIVDTGANLLDGQWHLIGSTYDGQTIRAYKDGVMINSAEWPGTLRRGSYSVGIGQFANNNNYGTKGYEDDVRIYASALSDEDILDLYETRAEVEESGTLYAKSFLSNVVDTANRLAPLTQDTLQVVSSTCTREYDANNNEWTFTLINGQPYVSFIIGGNVQSYIDEICTLSFEIFVPNSETLYHDMNNYPIYLNGVQDTRIANNDTWRKTFSRYIDAEGGHWTKIWSTVTSKGIGDTLASAYSNPVYYDVEPGHSARIYDSFRISNSTVVKIRNVQYELKNYATPFTTTYRPVIELPNNIQLGESEIAEQGIANYEDFSTAGIVNGLVGFWQLNDNVNNVNDYSGNDYHGVNSGAVSYGDYYKFNNASMITLPQLPSFKQISIIAKIRRATNTDWDGIFGTQGSVLHFQLEASGRLNAYLYGTVSLGTNTGINYITADGQWHLAVLTFDGTNLKLYKDDILDATAVDASPGGEIPSSDLYRIGLVHDTTRYFNGDIDYVKVFNRALSAEEISIEYNTMVKNEVQFHDSGKVYAKKLKQY